MDLGGGERRGRQIQRVGSGVQAKAAMDLVRTCSIVTTTLVSTHDGWRWIWFVNRHKDEQRGKGAQRWREQRRTARSGVA
ncbi:hypothetical protein U1Q18_016107 [Sarracenia purpurea var. burkii]